MKKKKWIVFVLSVMLFMSNLSINYVSVEASSYSNDYRYWSQGASDDSGMRKYGCWVVAQAKLLYETGIDRTSSFHPDTYLQWQKNNGYIDSGYYQINGGEAPVAYASQKGKTLSYLGYWDASDDQLWFNINAGYYTILRVNGGSHYVMIANEISKEKGELYCYDSYSSHTSANPRSISNYSIHDGGYVYSYVDNSMIISEFPLINDGVYRIKNVNSGKYIDIFEQSLENEVDLHQWEYADTPSQRWKAVQHSDGYSFISTHSGKAMDIYLSSTSEGADLHQYTYGGNEAQRFKLVGRGNGSYSIHPVCSNLALDIYGSSIENGGNIKQYAYHGGANQLFVFEPVDTTAPTISNVTITNLTRDGYTVNCDVTDSSGIARVCFPTWTTANGQDDINTDWYNNTAVITPVSGNTYSFDVRVSDHNNEAGIYETHIYAYDTYGNWSIQGTGATVNRDIPLTGFTLNTTKLDLLKSETKTLSVTGYSPVDTTSDKTASWSSEDSSIASVDIYGNVTGHKKGTTNIICTIAGIQQICEIEVLDTGTGGLSGWVTSLPDEVMNNIEKYYIEEKKQYRSQTKSETVSTDSNLTDWTLSGWYWGDWQSCGADVTATENREVTTDSQYVKTQYKYNHWHNYSSDRMSPVEYSGWNYEETGWLDYPLTAAGTSNAGGTKYASTTPLGPCGKTTYWYNESRQDVYNTTYRYRDKVFKYYKWSDWSDWTDTLVTASDTVNVEERTVYRYTMINPFADVPESMYYYQPVLWALQNNITAGLTATEFAADAVCTRGQVVTFLWRAMGQPEPVTASNPFVDVSSSQYYYKAVLWAMENNITAGLTAMEFAPDATVIRGQFVTFLHRMKQTPSYSVSNPFVDVPGNTYYTNAVLWALENGVTAGLDATHFAPEDFCTRGQVVTFLYRALNE